MALGEPGTGRPRKGKFTFSFRLRVTPEWMDMVREHCGPGTGRQQQEFIRTAVEWYVREINRKPGETLVDVLVSPTVEVAKHKPSPKREPKRAVDDDRQGTAAERAQRKLDRIMGG